MFIEKFDKHLNYFKRNHSTSFKLEEGFGKVLISAPHSTTHVRDGKTLFSEPHVGAIAKLLHEDLGCPIIYKSANCGDDPNFDLPSPYKDAIVQYVKDHDVQCVLDLHQLSPKRPCCVDIGTNSFANVFNLRHYEILDGALKQFLACPIFTDTLFKSSMPQRISTFVANVCKVSCFQIEFQSNLFKPTSSDFNAEGVYNALAQTIRIINEN